jgi:hypothetical protein
MLIAEHFIDRWLPFRRDELRMPVLGETYVRNNDETQKRVTV